MHLPVVVRLCGGVGGRARKKNCASLYGILPVCSDVGERETDSTKRVVYGELQTKECLSNIL